MDIPLSASDEVTDALGLLAEMSTDFAASGDVGETLRKALARITAATQAEAASLFMLENDETELVCRGCVGPVDITGLRLPAGAGIVGRTVRENACQIVRDVSSDKSFGKIVDEKTGFTTRSILCAPLGVKDLRMGAVEIINKIGGDGRFKARDQNLLRALASSAALAIHNARLASQLVEQGRLRREMELAAEIQRSLLPAPRGDAFPACGINRPAGLISGDFYDFFELPDKRVCFNLGDVSGKGMNASLLMAKTSSLYRCLGKTVHDPGRLLAMVNAEICETNTRGMFVTMVGGIFDPRTGIARFANAGHEPPLFRDRRGGFTALPADAPPLGIAADIVDEAGFPETEIDLSGGVLYIFTDGVTEGYMEDGAMLGVEGLKSLLSAHRALGLCERLVRVADHIDRPGVALHDDLTILAIADGGMRS